MIVQATPSARVSLRGRRRGNEDAVLSVRLSDGRYLCAVADGMGGHRCGEVASAMALEALQRALEEGAQLREAVKSANGVVYAEAARSPERAGMGTTLVVLLSSISAYEVANVGDSRAYRVDAEGVQQITVDHSFAAEAIRTGSMTPEEVARSPWRNALTRSLGTQPEVEVDVFGPFPTEAPGHLVLLCSDGLYRALPDAGLREHLLAAGDLEAAVSSLAELALARGSDDNVSAVVAAFGAVSPRTEPVGRVSVSSATLGDPRRSFRGSEPLREAVLVPPPSVASVRSGARGSTARPVRRSALRWVRSIFREQNLFLFCVVALVVWFVSLLTRL